MIRTKTKLILEEMKVASSIDGTVPSNVSVNVLEKLAEQYKTLESRIAYLLYTGVNRVKKENRDSLVAEKPPNREIIWGKSIFRWITPHYMSSTLSSYAVPMCGLPSVVVDASFVHDMDAVRRTEMATIFRKCIQSNAYSRSPCKLLFTDVPKDWWSSVSNWLPSGPLPFLEVTDRSLLELFPRESIVYLTQYRCQRQYIVKEFDENKTYVVGATIEGRKDRLSVSKAMAEKLQTASVPYSTPGVKYSGYLTPDQLCDAIRFAYYKNGDWPAVFAELNHNNKKTTTTDLKQRAGWILRNMF